MSQLGSLLRQGVERVAQRLGAFMPQRREVIALRRSWEAAALVNSLVEAVPEKVDEIQPESFPPSLVGTEANRRRAESKEQPDEELAGVLEVVEISLDGGGAD
jgi:hypothetical protein